MTGIGMNLTEYTSQELMELQLAIMFRLEQLENGFHEKAIERLRQWEVKVYEAKQEVLKRERINQN